MSLHICVSCRSLTGTRNCCYCGSKHTNPVKGTQPTVLGKNWNHQQRLARKQK